ncbi:MAG: polysaccharide deacetylase family protein [candidate division FCPU426 bacterium]
MRRKAFLMAWLGSLAFSATAFAFSPPGHTRILRFPQGKAGAVSLTFDDGTENQFKLALPVLHGLGLPATFFIITGEVQGSLNHQRFVGRPFAEILKESAEHPTSEANFFERASALWSCGYQGMGDISLQIGGAYEAGKKDEAMRLADETLKKIREQTLKPEPGQEQGVKQATGTLTWDQLRRDAAYGFEMASHSVSHPYLCVMDDANLEYELNKSRQEILAELGPKHTFSVECPFGIEDKRAVGKALELYELARNRMPDTEVLDILRSEDSDPALATGKEYVRWQRGPHSDTAPGLMQEWVDKTAAQDKTWLVLVFHGVEGIGWQPKPIAELTRYFEYIKARRKKLWVATFQDVGKYIRERLHTKVSSQIHKDSIEIRLDCPLDPALYSLGLSLKTALPKSWKKVRIAQAGAVQVVPAVDNEVMYTAFPGSGPVTLTEVTP